MANSHYREEQQRNTRRLSRQILGAIALILACIGVYTVIGWCISLLGKALDDTDLKEDYANRLYSLVMLDVQPFDDTADVDPAVFKQAAVWDAVYQVELTGGSLDDSYERDADTGSALIPALEVDAYIANLLGPDYTVEEGSFDADAMTYYYDEAAQCYLLPVTGAVALYRPRVEKISTMGTERVVTVGYIPTGNNSQTSEFGLTEATEPTKYRDFVFTKYGSSWYLTALQESEYQPAATATPSPTAAATVAPDEENPNLPDEQAYLGGEASPDDTGDEAPAEETYEGEDVSEEDASEETDTSEEDTPPEDEGDTSAEEEASE